MISTNFVRNNERAHEIERLKTMLIVFERRRDDGAYDADPRMRVMCDHFIENAQEKIERYEGV